MLGTARFWLNFGLVGALALIVALFVGSYNRALREYDLSEGWNTIRGVLDTFGGIKAFGGLAISMVLAAVIVIALARLAMTDFSDNLRGAVTWAIIGTIALLALAVAVVKVFSLPSGGEVLSVLGGGVFLAIWLGVTALFTRK